MFNNSKRKEKRLMSEIPDSISTRTYNCTIGIMLLYGFLTNALLTFFAGNIVASINPIVLIIGYFICCIIGSVMTAMSSNPFVSFIGYNFIAVPIGALLSLSLPTYPIQHILSALIITACVTVGMIVFAMIKPNIFAKLGWSLFIALLIALIAEVIAMLLGYRGDIFNWIFVVLFSLYIGYDWHKAQAYPKTVDNAIDSAVDLYLDIINIFIRILSIISKKD